MFVVTELYLTSSTCLSQVSLCPPHRAVPGPLWGALQQSSLNAAQHSAALMTAWGLLVQQTVGPQEAAGSPVCAGHAGPRADIPCEPREGNPWAAFWGIFGLFLQCDCCGCLYRGGNASVPKTFLSPLFLLSSALHAES